MGSAAPVLPVEPIGSAGSAGSIGSVGSVGSVGSAGSVGEFRGDGRSGEAGAYAGASRGPGVVDGNPPAEVRAGMGGDHRGAGAVHSAPVGAARDDLLGGIGDWGPTATPVGTFQLVPVRVERDLPLVTRWMNDPAVSAFWELAGPESVTEEHLNRQLDGDGRSVPCIGLLEDTPVSYWEIYRADLDHLARHYPARPHDTGIHLLIGGVAHRGHGLGSALLRAVADLVLDRRPACARVVAEPDLRNIPSVSAFLSGGFRFSAEVELPGKRAALMMRDRALRDLM
ncbi:acetyltransferase [Streptomyces sp. NBC_01571]|uniref:GNAT family N-acetyltransferase n=1 Tax=Streptomyces sp. NBC_01571 TaxID=2975883 RepID=UPI0022560464|nr:GNAT family N-acetyltransferase [Streptomyces sp. NBC_01571]MCX4577970.1 acetyltransferase [Streptomyces sp. NBC_01571]